MPTTTLIAPTIITQVESYNDVLNRYSIPWNNVNNILDQGLYAVTDSPIHTISGFWQEKFYTETHRIDTTGYNFEDNGLSVVGIEALVVVQRLSRVQDLVIQLTLDGELVGDNLASTINPVQSNQYTGEYDDPLIPVGDVHVYGSPTELWGRAWTSSEIANSTFGLAVSFKSNQIVPHRDLVYLDQVALRITYA